MLSRPPPHNGECESPTLGPSRGAVIFHNRYANRPSRHRVRLFGFVGYGCDLDRAMGLGAVYAKFADGGDLDGAVHSLTFRLRRLAGDVRKDAGYFTCAALGPAASSSVLRDFWDILSQNYLAFRRPHPFRNLFRALQRGQISPVQVLRDVLGPLRHAALIRNRARSGV
jgi:hypothetical protein